MGLPKIDLPLFELEIPSTKKKVKYRPFTVKEEKILLIAKESKDVDQMVLGIKQIVNNCVQKVDVEKLAMFDLEYILINIRAKSVDNELAFTIKDPDTEERIELSVDINDIKLSTPEKHTNRIRLSDTTSLLLRYPTINELNILMGAKSNKETLFEIMIRCIESMIVEEDQVYKMSDYSEDEIIDFIDGLTANAIQNIHNFFETMPRLRHEVKYVNNKGANKTFVVEGMETFFI